MGIKKKVLYIIIVVLTIALISCIYLLNKKKRESNLIPVTTQLLSKLTDLVNDDIDQTLGNYDYLYPLIKKDIDSFYIYSEYKPIYCSDQFKDYFKKHTDCDSEIFNIINSIQTNQSIEFEFIKKLVDFVFITRLQRNKLRNYCLFDGVGVDVFPDKDTILKGEEYTSTVGYFATFYETIPTMIVDGDTVPTVRDTQIFKETPQKSGKIKHECMITFNWQGHIMEMPFTIEYYVK